jgi:transposase InsO family protein
MPRHSWSSRAKRPSEIVYNMIRPHQALGYLTPAEYLASLGVDV